jgi:CelD/BcsL family acetyltransferase involved in cellulose biosynthesis
MTTHILLPFRRALVMAPSLQTTQFADYPFHDSPLATLPMMNVQRISTLSEWVLHKETWNTLARSHPHTRFEWMVTWWRFYGQDQELFVLCIRDDDDDIVGYAPWYMDNHRLQGKTIRFLGSGKACGDHLSVICDLHQTKCVATAIADYLVEAMDHWRHLELIGGDADDAALRYLGDELGARGTFVNRRAGVACYKVLMPGTWADYLQTRSKSTRRKLKRQIEKCDSSDFNVTHCRCGSLINDHWSDFVSLHQKRRHDLGTDGCFDDTTFGDFLHAATLKLADANMVELAVLKYRGQSVAAELGFTSDTTTYYYQSGMDPDLHDHYPGMMLLAYTAKHSVDRGANTLDLLRGDEPYKLRWHGQKVETVEIRAAGTAWQARLRQQAWLAGATLKDWFRSTPSLFSPTTDA